MTYIRVVPRDLFNEASLLKCVGKVVLMIEDGMIPWLSYRYDGEAFNVMQNVSSGGIYIANIEFFANNKTLSHERPLNSRKAWPLYFETEENSYSVFDEDNGDFILTAEDIA